MSTSIQGSFHAVDAFTVRMQVGASTADWVVSKGTTYATPDDVLDAWNTAITALSTTVTKQINAADHTASCAVDTGGLSFSVTWSHAGDGSRVRDYLGEVGDLSSEPDGYTFDNPIAVGWYPSYDLRSFSISGEPWSTQRTMTGSGAVTTNNPHHGRGDAIKYTARAEFWYGSAGTYAPHEALASAVDGIMEHGQPFTITNPDRSWVCRFPNEKTLELIPEPVEGVERGTIYRVSFPVVVVE